MREHRRAKKRRKLDRGGKTARPVAGTDGPPRERASYVHSLMEVTLGRRDRDRKEAALEMLSLSFDEGAGEKRPLAPKMPDLSGNGGATESDRGVCRSTVHVVENAAVREHRPERYSALRFEEIVGNRPEARWASSNAHRPGAVSILAPQSVPRPQGSGSEEARGQDGAGRALA
jgi:hypothetical protein